MALKLLLKPWRWKSFRSASAVLEEEFKKHLGVKYAIAFNGGRAAFDAILNCLGIKDGDEVLLQGFTCNSVVIPILKLGAKPVFIDIDETLNVDPNNLEKKISKRSKAVIVQHTFGWPAKTDKILEICKEGDEASSHLFLIEDCAHSLGAEYKGKKVGVLGDAAFFSFGRDKVISSVFGGMATTDNDKIGERLKNFQRKLEFPSNFWTLKQLLHPILTTALILPAYGINQHLGRVLLAFFNKLSLLSKAVSKEEKRGEFSSNFPKKFPDALATLALNQFRKLDMFNSHRKEMANFYAQALGDGGFILPAIKLAVDNNPAFLRYPVLAQGDTNKILKKARKRKIYLDDGWRKTPIVPPDTAIVKMQYEMDSCPRAEKIAKSIINLPTHINISKDDAKKIADFIKSEFLRSKGE